jgi:hypothetical protein
MSAVHRLDVGGGVKPPLRYSRDLIRKVRSYRRYRRSLNHKLCRLGIGRWFFYAPFGTLREIKVFGLGGEYGRKAET